MHDFFAYHKVVYKHCAREVENISVTLCQIYSRQYVLNINRIGRALSKIWHKIFGLLLLARGVLSQDQHWSTDWKLSKI